MRQSSLTALMPQIQEVFPSFTSAEPLAVVMEPDSRKNGHHGSNRKWESGALDLEKLISFCKNKKKLDSSLS